MNIRATHFIQWSSGQLTPTNEVTANKFNEVYKLDAVGVPVTEELIQKYMKQSPKAKITFQNLPASTNVDDY